MRHTMDNPDSGSAVAMHPGDELEVRLRQPGGSGYLWSMRTVPQVIEARGDGTEVGAAGDGSDAPTLPGAAAIRTFRFEAMMPGRGTLRLALSRPWEDEAVEVREIALLVKKT